MMRRREQWSFLSKLIRCRAIPIHSSATRRLTLYPSPQINSSTLFPAPPFPNFPQFHASCLCSQSSGEQFSSCWSCNARSQQSLFLLCHSCGAIQPLDHSIDYFRLFGLEKNYDVKENLERKYKDWQKKLHPDLVHTKSQKEREFAAEQSARITDAYRILSNPRLRAMYILKLEGVDVNEEETITDPQLLAEIMEIREAVEEASNSEALTDIQSQMREKLQHWSNSFANAFRSQKYEEAIECIRRMTYYDRVNEEIVKRL